MEEEEEAHHGGDGDERAGHDETVVGGVEAAEVVDGDGKREELGLLEDDLRTDEIIPCAENRDEKERADHRAHEWNHDREEDPEFAGAVEASGLEKLGGDGIEHRLTKEEDAEGGSERGENEAAVGVEEAELPEELVTGSDEERGGNNEGAEHERGEPAAGAEVEFGESVSTHGARECGGGAGDAGEEEGVEERATDGVFGEKAFEIREGDAIPGDAEKAVAGRKEEGGEEVGLVFDGGRRHPEERDERERGEEDKRGVDERKGQAAHGFF